MDQNRNKEISLIGLFGTETFENLQKRLASVTDFSFSTIDYRGKEIVKNCFQESYINHLYHHGESIETMACQMKHALAAAKAAIHNLPYLYLCQCGLVKAAIPIVVNEQYLGAIICGYVRCYDMDYVDPRTGLPLIQKDFHEKNIIKLDEDTTDIPSFSAKKIKDTADLVFMFVQEMCQKKDYELRFGDDLRKKVHFQDLRQKNKELKKTVNDLQYRTMQSIMYPQTLLNMLVTISSVSILEEAEMTQKMIQDFSSMLRYYIEYRREYISLEYELSQIENYLSIIQLRYEKRLQVEVKRNGDVKNQMIPKLLILPLMEYMINYGILNHSFKGMVICNADIIDERCVISMRLNYGGEKDTEMGFLKESGNIMDDRMFHEQLKQLEDRITYEYGEDYKLNIESDYIVLDIPRTRKQA